MTVSAPLPGPLSQGLDRQLRELGVLTPQPTDATRLSLLLSLYDVPAQTVLDLLRRFLADRHCQLERLYRMYRQDPRLDQVARAPEALLLFERLEHDRDRLQDLWRKHLPLDELEQTATFFGVPL